MSHKFSEKKLMLEDIIKEFNIPIILVSNSGLGAINHTVLTVSYLRKLGLKVKGIILNKSDIIHRDNKKIIKELTGVNNISTVPKIEDIEEYDLNELNEVLYGI